MEEESTCPSHNCDIMKILPHLMDIPVDNITDIVPSRLIYELQMSTEERLELLSKPTRKYRIITKIGTFSRTPDVVVFQNFKAAQLYKTTLSLVNLHSSSRHLRIITSSSPYFEVTHPAKDSSIKVAPGMSYIINIIFFPLENKDYRSHITFLTDGESFDVPLYAIGPRPLIDLPDTIILPPTSVGVVSEKSLIIQNFGEVLASYVISCKDPFSIQPYRDKIKSNDMMELKILCKPFTIGSLRKSFDFIYGDINLKILIQCEVNNANIYLENEYVRFGDIYMGLKQHSSVTLHNRSTHLIDFQWKLHKTFAVDKLRVHELTQKINAVKEYEKIRCTKLERMNIIDYDGHSNICNRNFEDEVKELDINNQYLYQNPAFTILPLTGHILPNQTKTFTIIFSPLNNLLYNSKAYLDVTGRDERLCLDLLGRGKGPNVVLNIKTLNVNKVFLCATHHYEVALRNIGNISATVMFMENETDFGGEITCKPSKLRLPYQDSCDAFVLSFCSKMQGKFVEKVQFLVKESQEVIEFIMMGNVICPLLTLNIDKLDFGIIPFGFKRKKEFTLTNDSQVPIEYNLQITCGDSDCNEEEFTEFFFNPNHGIVEPYSRITVEIELATKAVQEVNKYLEVKMWGSKRYATLIPLSYNCVYPQVKCFPSEVYIKFCFVDYEYTRTIRMRNESNVHGFVTYTPVINGENNSNIMCEVSKTDFNIKSFEEVEIDLTIKINKIGLAEFPLIFTIAGNKPTEMCKIICNGQGPVVSYCPDELDFKGIPLLGTVSRALILINDSPITAKMFLSTPPHSVFKLEQDTIEINPEDKLVVPVNAFLTNAGKFKNVINVKVENGESLSINVSGEGIGSSIQMEPDLEPIYDTKILLTHQRFVLQVKITNLGKKYHKLLWNRKSIVKNFKEDIENDNIRSHFSIRPNYMELACNESKIIDVRGYSAKKKIIEEDFYCHAMIGKSNNVTVVRSFMIRAEFIEPSIKFSKNILNFLYTTMTDIDSKLEDDIKICNNTKITLSIKIETVPDFFTIVNPKNTSEDYQEIESEEELELKINFVPKIREKRYVKLEGELCVHYLDHPKKDKISLYGEVCFPTVKLIPSEFYFKSVPLNGHSYTQVVIQNITFVPVTYKWEFLDDLEIADLSTSTTEIHDSLSKKTFLTNPEDDIENNAHSVLDVQEKKISSEVIFNESTNFSNSQNKVKNLQELWDETKYSTEIKQILLPVVAKYIEDSKDLHIYEHLKINNNLNVQNINKIFTIEPFEGYLEPYEYGLVSIGFFPPPNKKLNVTALCKVEGGEKEHLILGGLSSKISYTMDKREVEFGNQLFCEVCSESIILTNTGFYDFYFSIICDDIHAAHAELEDGWTNVTPKAQLLCFGESVTLEIKYFPGVVGEFYEEVSIEIGYLETFKIKLHGYAVCSQVYLPIPRSSIYEVDSSVTYMALSTLTMDYLDPLKEVSNSITSLEAFEYPTDIPLLQYESLKQDGWTIITSNEFYPTEIDVDMAIERIILFELLMDKCDLLMYHTFKPKIITIPGFTVPEYVLDFGYVILGKPVCYSVLIYNYGPVKTDVKLVTAPQNTLEKNEIKLEFQNKRVDVGQNAEMYVIFSPTVKRFGESDTDVEDTFSIWVRHGAKIPIRIKATVTTPRLLFNYNYIDFGLVNIGHCYRRSMVIKNNGFVLSKWNAEIEVAERKRKNIYIVIPNFGSLEPGKKALINIYFMPTVRGSDTASLVISVEGNLYNYVINLFGKGAKSSLKFNDRLLEFKSALPYSQDNDVLLTVQNMSQLPIEFCFSDFDQKYEEEKLWIDTYLKHHNLEYVFIPQRIAGEKLPDIFQDNYLALIDKVRNNIVKNESEDNIDLNEDALAKYSPNEINCLINNYIENIQIEKDTVNTDSCNLIENLSSHMTIIEPVVETVVDLRQLKSGIFIIFHGGPKTDYLKAAHKLGIMLKIPVYNIDRLLYESLVTMDLKSVSDIKAMIDEAFEEIASANDRILAPGDDEYDELLKKVILLLTKPKKGKKKESAKEKKSKTSVKSSSKQSNKEKSIDGNTFLNIPVDFISDILKCKLMTFTQGVIIESLSSEFLRNPMLALNTLLCAIGNVKYIQLIILSYTLRDYIRREEQQLKRKDELNKIMIEGIHEIKINEEPSKKEKKSAKSKTEKTSSKSKPKKEKPKDYTKQILKGLPKQLKLAFEVFEQLLNEIRDLCEDWDKKNINLTKMPNNKSNNTIKRESRTSMKTSKDDRSKGLGKKKRDPSICPQSLDIKESLICDEKGIPLWIIDNANNERAVDFTTIICHAMVASIEFQEAKTDLIKSLEGVLEEKSTFFTVIQKLPRSDKALSDVFVINTNDAASKRTDTTVVIKTSSSSDRKRSIRQISSDRNNFDKRSITSSDKGKEVTSKFQPRYILRPQETAMYKLSFYPKKCGKYGCSYNVEIVGLDLIYQIHCIGICELPTIDFNPETVFPRILKHFRDKSLYDNFVYIKEENIFDIGSIIASSDKSNIYKTCLLMKNSSNTDCEVKAELSENVHFSLESDTFLVEPESKEYLTLAVSATKTGCIHSNIFVSIKNNPKIEKINLIAKPCKLEFNVHPKIMYFDKVPLKYAATKKLTLKNSSTINLRWKFINPEWALKIYKISETEGSLNLYSVSEILFTYTPEEEEIHPRKNLELQVFDVNHSEDIPIHTDFIGIHADSVIYDIEYNDHIKLGKVKGKKQHNISFDLANKGTCQVCAVFSEIINPLDKKYNRIRKFFQLLNHNEILYPQKTVTANIVFKPTKILNFTEVPIFVCSFVECGNQENIINSFVVKVSADVRLSSFEICPASEIHFGYQQIFETKKQVMEIKNTGIFPFTYSIVSKKKLDELKMKGTKSKTSKSTIKDKKSKENVDKDKKSVKDKKSKENSSSKKSKEKSDKKSKEKSDKKSKSTKSSKSKKSNEEKSSKGKKSKKITKLNVDGFAIISSTGEVGPNKTVQIEIECTPSQQKQYEEIIIVNVSEPQKVDINGRHFTLHVIGSEPCLNFNNFIKTFREQFMVDDIENFIGPQNIGSHCIFATSEKALYFKNVCINTTSATKIYLENVGQVNARVTAKLMDANKNIFTISPNVLDINSQSTKFLTITFKPDSLEEFVDKLEITYNSTTSNKFILMLNGSSCIPQITLIEPNCQKSELVVNFLPTLIGRERSQKICIKNVGKIFAKVIIDICNNDDKMFTLLASDKTVRLLNADLEDFKNVKYTTVVNLEPEEIADFDLIYKPTSIKQLKIEIKIHTVNNPFDVTKLYVNAESYYHTVYCDELVPCHTDENENDIGYHLDFGFAPVNCLQKKNFKIYNNSENDIYKFEFIIFDNLTFMPSIGHLKPLCGKEIIATFLPKQPCSLSRVLIAYKINKIKYVEPELELLSWDDRQTFIRLQKVSQEIVMASSSVLNKSTYNEIEGEIADTDESKCSDSSDHDTKLITFCDEPKIELISDTLKVIPIFVTILADYSSYTSENFKIDFPDTHVMEESGLSFSLNNNGQIPLEIDWLFANTVIEATMHGENANNTHQEYKIYIKENDFCGMISESSSSSLFSPNCSCLCLQEDTFPFSINPKKILIEPNKEQQFIIYFSPKTAAHYCVDLKSVISCLDPKLNNIDIKITAKSFLPIFYFEIEKTNYLNRRPIELQKYINNKYSDLEIIEFASVGIGSLSKRKINVVNPTTDIYSYKLEIMENTQFSFFDCTNPSGFIAGGKKSEIELVFKPHELGYFEEYYLFSITKKNLRRHILLVGECRQPRVYFTRPYIELQPTVLNVKVDATIALRNDEDTELSFKFIRESLFNESNDQQLEVTPMYGTLLRKSDSCIQLIYLAEKVGKANFFLKCQIEKMAQPLNFHVSVNCMEVLPVITYVAKDEKLITLEKDKENIIDFLNITPKKKQVINFSISNIGDTGLFYTWHINRKSIEHLFDIAVNNENEFIESKGKSEALLSLEAHRETILKDFKIKLYISHGPTYSLSVFANSEKRCTFSFHNYDFGYCLVQKRKTNYYNVCLEFKNLDTQSMMLENCYVNNEDLTVDFKSSQVLPSSSQYITIYFHPLKIGKYNINIPLTVNAVIYNIKIKGEAVNINLQLVNTNDKYIDLGNVLAGSTIKYPVQVINKTPTQVHVFFDLWDNLPFHIRENEKIVPEMKVPDVPVIKESKKDKKKGKSEKSTDKSTVKSSKTGGKDKKKKKSKMKIGHSKLEIQEPVLKVPEKSAKDFMTVTPRDCTTLETNKKYTFFIEFRPTEQLENFNEKIFYEVQDYTEPLCIVKGLCSASEFSLDKEILAFSNVIIGCKHSLSILLKNSCDFKGRFKWLMERQTNAVKISPANGFVGPNSELKIWVTFEPKTVECQFKLKAKCLIDKMKKHLELTIMGNSLKVPDPSSTITFGCPVREKVSQKIAVPNTTKTAWELQPTISNNQFSVPSNAIIEPQSEYSLEIIYHPKQMTTTSPHKAILFLPLPEGKATLYELVGTTQPPLPFKKIEIEVKGKTNHIELLKIENWLNIKQCFKVRTELTSLITTKSLYRTSGNELVELLPNEQKNYKWSIYVVNEIPMNFKVIFTNIDTKEYMYYEISVKVVPSGPQESIDLTTSVRKQINAKIKLQNPIDLPVTFYMICDNTDLTYDKMVTVNPYTTRDLDIAYFPTKSGITRTNFDAKCDELGTFSYSLNLKTNPPPTEDVVHFKTELGKTVSKYVLIKNVFKAPLEFSAKFDHFEFSMEKSTPIMPGETEKITFYFDPCQLGFLTSKVIITSVVSGDYIYPFVGECSLPTPKGPFIIKSGGIASIPFENPFIETKVFCYSIDSDDFVLKTTTEEIKPKKATKIIVSPNPSKYLDINYPSTAKLIVNCEDSDLHHIKWIFYIKSDQPVYKPSIIKV